MKCLVCLFDVYSDLNGSKSGHVYKFLRSQGFISSYDAAHLYTDADAHKVFTFIVLFLRLLPKQILFLMTFIVSCSG